MDGNSFDEDNYDDYNNNDVITFPGLKLWCPQIEMHQRDTPHFITKFFNLFCPEGMKVQEIPNRPDLWRFVNPEAAKEVQISRLCDC